MLFHFLFLCFLPAISLSQPLTGTFIDCGSSVSSTFNGLDWLPDTGYVSAGSSRNVSTPVLNPTLSTVRTFPLENNVFKKFCYEIPIIQMRKYLIRTTYYYGGVNGNINPPVFDQIVDGTLWSLVNTTEEYVNGNYSYYEGIFNAAGKNLSVCLAANTHTDSDPFISALEVVLLWDQLYNSTNFSNNALSLVARHNFGGPMIGYGNDLFNRYWQPFRENTPSLISGNLASSSIWNRPPDAVFHSHLAENTAETLTLLWPPGILPTIEARIYYYISLYFAEDQTSVSGSSRSFDITINGVPYYNNLTVTQAGVSVFANQWPLSGVTNLTLTPTFGSSVGPLINAGEVFQVLPAGNRTHTRDVIAMIDLRSSFENPPADWNGDPCLPRGYSWTGVTCSDGSRIRVIALNLASVGLSGLLSPSINRMTALTNISLGNNSLSGTIPDLSLLQRLQFLHLEDNQFGGVISPLLRNLIYLRELFLQNNNLTGQVPSDLSGRPGLTLRFTPGNPFLTPP